MRPIQLPTEKYISIGLVRQKGATLLQDHYQVLRVLVQKVYPEGAPSHGPPWASSHWACDVAL